MEVTTVSPSPASPTERDDLCETDVTNVAIHSVTLLICLCGLAGNGAVLCLLSPKKCNYGIFDLAVADFLFLLFTVPSALLFLVEDRFCTPIMDMMYVSFLFQLSVFSYYWGVFLLTAFSLGKDMTLLCKLCSCCQLHPRLRLLVWGTQYWAFFSLFTLIPALISLCPSHEQGHCRAALISMYIVILLLFAAPVLTSSAINIIRARHGSKKQRQPQRRDNIISLIVLITLLLGLCNFLQQLGYFAVRSEVFFLLTCIHSSIKPFIYFLAGRCSSPCSVKSLRVSLQRVFEELEKETDPRNDAHRDTVI